MNWLGDLYDVYQRVHGSDADEMPALMPIAHTTLQAHIEIVLDTTGSFLRAEVIPKERATTLVPCTESSSGRAGSKPAAHPLCDKLQYIAADFTEHGGIPTSGFANDTGEPHRNYLALLSAWTKSEHSHPKLHAILNYVRQGSVVADLVDFRILPTDTEGNLHRAWGGNSDDAPDIFRVLPTGQTPQDAVIRWRIDTGGVQHGCWEDEELIHSWISHYASL